MKRIPVFTSILLIAGVSATMAFSHPLIVRNGAVRGVSQNGESLDIRNSGLVQTYVMRQRISALPSRATIAVGDHVTVFAECFHSGAANRNASGATSARNTGGGTAAATSRAMSTNGTSKTMSSTTSTGSVDVTTTATTTVTNSSAGSTATVTGTNNMAVNNANNASGSKARNRTGRRNDVAN